MVLLFFTVVPAVRFVFFFPPSQALFGRLGVSPICDVKGWALSKVIPQKAGFGPGEIAFYGWRGPVL